MRDDDEHATEVSDMRYTARSTGTIRAAGDGATTNGTALTTVRTPPQVERHRPHPTAHGVTRPAPDGLRAAPPRKSGTASAR
jgi:hypothetical protein